MVILQKNQGSFLPLEFNLDSSEEEYESGDEQNDTNENNEQNENNSEPEYEFETMRDYESDTDEYLNPDFGKKDAKQEEVIFPFLKKILYLGT